MATERPVRRIRKRQSMQKLIAKSAARAVVARVITDFVDYLWQAWDRRKEHEEK
jgi:hypothetical protein